MEEIPDARNFHDDVQVLHASGASRELRQILVGMGHIIRRLHDHGVWHPDLHPGNFLLRGATEPHLIDLHSCLFPGYLPRFLRVRSVAAMAYLREVIPDSEFRWLLAGYLLTSSSEGRPIEQLGQSGMSLDMELVPDNPSLPAQLLARILEFERPIRRRYAHRLRRRLRSRTKRCLVRSTTFAIERASEFKWYRRRAVPREQLEPYVRSVIEGDAIKIRETGQVVRVELEEQGPVIVKHRRYSWRKSLASLWSAHRLKSAWIGSHGFTVRQLPTPEPLALVERRVLGCVCEAWLFVRECAGAESLDQFLWHAHSLPGHAVLPAERRALARHLGELLRRLHETGVRPHDLSPQNILVRRDALAALCDDVLSRAESAPPAAIAFVDLDDVRFQECVDQHKRLRNLVQVANLPEGYVSVADRLRALRAYDGGRQVYYTRTTIRGLRRALLDEACRTINRMTRLEYTGLMETIPK